MKLATHHAVSRMLDDIRSLADLVVTSEDTEWSHSVVDQGMRFVTQAMEDAGGDAETAMGRIEQRILRHLRRAEAHSPDTAVLISRIGDSVKGGQGVDRAAVMKAVHALLDTEAIHGIGEEGARGKRVWIPRASTHLKAVS